MTSRWTIKFASQPDASHEYEITPGWVETSTWTEELDSASIAFGQVAESDRLTDLKPYEFCRIFDRETGETKEWLVDGFQEDEIDTVNHVYRYQVALMSETKLLEKIQLPNISITASLTSDSAPTIEEEIDSLLTRYVPWVVSGTADDPTPVQLITRGTETIDGLDNECKEVNLNAPDLREAITTFTTQIGALPVVTDRKLNFLDLRTAGETDFEEVGLTSIARSNSSDAFTTRLEVQTDRMIDQTGSGVRTEITTFRNPDGAVLKLNGNAVLPVDFPIYTIDKVLASVYGWVRPAGGTSSAMCGVNACWGYTFGGGMVNGSSGTASSSSFVTFTMRFKEQISTRNSSGSASSATMWSFVQGQAVYGYFQPLHCENMQYEQLASAGWVRYGVLNVTGSGSGIEALFTIEQPANTTDWLIYAFPRYQDSNGNEQTFLALVGTTHTILPTSENLQGYYSYLYQGAFVYYQKGLIIQPCIDLTALFKENSERQLLSTDWNDFYTWTGSSTFNGLSIDTLATYYYSTIGYSIGDSEISGWSDTFNDTIWWWDNEHTVGEIIYEWFLDAYSDDLLEALEDSFDVDEFIELLILQGHLPDALAEVLRNPPLPANIATGGDGGTQCWGYLQFPRYKSDYAFVLSTSDWNGWEDIGDGYADLTDASYLNMIFSITYHPISQMNIQSLKDRDEEGAYRIQNYDSPTGSFANFDDFMIAERDKVNRLGEDTLLINQRVTDTADIQPVGSLFRDEYIVYRREVSHWQGFSTAQYYASRDAVAKNFSTALQRKYRAYENVDYSQSVTRLENRTIFAYIWVSNTAPSEPPTGIRQLARVRVNHPSALIYGTSEPMRKGVEADYRAPTGEDYTLYQFDLATGSYENGIALSILERDNATFGPQVLISEWTDETKDGVGGVPQQWTAFPDDFRDRHFLAITTIDNSILNADARAGFDYPELPYTWDTFTADSSRDYIIWLGDDFSTPYIEPDQDLAEVCGYTTQFEFWKGDIPSTLVRINWRNFARFQPWIRNPNNPETLYWGICTNANIDSSFNEGNGEAYSTTSANYSTAPLNVEVDDADTGLASVYASGIPMSSVNNWVILSGTDNATGKRYDIMALRLTALTGTARLNVQLTEFKTKRRMTEDEEGYIRFDEDTD